MPFSIADSLAEGPPYIGRSGRSILDAGDGLEGLEVVRAVVGLRAAGGEEGAKLIGKAAVADEVFDRVGGRGPSCAAGAPGTEVAQPAGELVEQRVAGGNAPASLVAVRQPDRARVVGPRARGDECRPAGPVDAAGAAVEAFDMRRAVHREARGCGVQAALPQVGLAQLVERVVGAAGQVFGVDGETEVFVPGLTGLALGAPALGLQQLADVLSSLPPTSPERYSSAVMMCDGSSGSATTRSPRRSRAVGMSVSMRSARKSISTPRARVDRDGERVRRVADVLGRGRLGGDEALLEDIGLVGHVAVGVHLLEAQEIECQRVVREPLGGEHGEILLELMRAEALEERVVFGGQLGARLLALVIVRGGVALEGEARGRRRAAIAWRGRARGRSCRRRG